MKICFFTCYPPDKRGSAVYNYNLIKAILEAESSASIQVLGTQASKPERIEVNDRLSVIRIWNPNSIFILRVLREILRARPDLVHIHFSLYSSLYCMQMPPLLFMLRLLKIRSVTHYDEVILPDRIHEITSAEPPMRALLLSLTRIICRLSSKVTVWKEFARRVLIHDYGIDEKRVRAIPHATFIGTGIDGQKAKDMLHLNEKPVVLLFGLLDDNKGIKHAIEALKIVVARVPNVILVIAGSPNPYRFKDYTGRLLYIESIRKLLRENDVEEHTIFISRYVSEDEKTLLFSASDVIIFPYTFTYKCSTSGVLKAAAGYGKPVVVTDIPFFKEDVENGVNGVVVPPKDAKALAEAIIHLLCNDHLRARLGANLRRNAEKMTWNKAASDLLEIYRELRYEGA
jgi:glycosyltransferase involved in cell wall biosynthesis